MYTEINTRVNRPDLNLLKQTLEATRSVWDNPRTRPAVRKNFAAVLDRGTAALGWEVYASDSEEKRCYHRCKSRFCPSCGYRATLLWLEKQEADLPDIPYAGVVFTMPRELWSIFKRNRHLLHDLSDLGAGVIQHWIRIRYGVTVGGCWPSWPACVATICCVPAARYKLSIPPSSRKKRQRAFPACCSSMHKSSLYRRRRARSEPHTPSGTNRFAADS